VGEDQGRDQRKQSREEVGMWDGWALGRANYSVLQPSTLAGLKTAAHSVLLRTAGLYGALHKPSLKSPCHILE
jgi:hypothetical protein